MDAKRTGFLKTEELDGALISLVRVIQGQQLKNEIDCLLKGRPLKSCHLIKLNPFLDSLGIMRVGGRLESAPIGYNQRHPIILPRTSKLTQLIIWSIHHKYLHAGPQLLLAMVRKQFWVLGARNEVKRITRRCTICQRFRAKPVKQLMGNLPVSRLQGEKAFLKAGVDFAGPLTATPWRKRGCRGQKVYVAVFVCLCTKAIHLELVTSLSTNAFMLALRRFIARRGKCSDLYSDNGTNFVGAKNQLEELNSFLGSPDARTRLQGEASKESINWHFIPPMAPNFGGLWEAAVKSTKFHLKRVSGSALLSFEELQTLLCQIESCLNSRPLAALTDSPEDFEPLTPAHFLVGSSPYFLPEQNYLSANINHLQRFQMIQQLQQVFWKRWQLEYIATLQERQKWKKKTENLAVNDLVVIRDDNQPPGKWALARVKELHIGADGLARVVTLITQQGLIKRPISKLCLLELN